MVKQRMAELRIQLAQKAMMGLTHVMCLAMLFLLMWWEFNLDALTVDNLVNIGRYILIVLPCIVARAMPHVETALVDALNLLLPLNLVGYNLWRIFHIQIGSMGTDILLLGGARTLVRMALTFSCFNFKSSIAINLVVSIILIVRYSLEMSMTNSCQGLMVRSPIVLFAGFEGVVVLGTSLCSYYFEQLLEERVRAGLEAEGARHAAHKLLSGMCDAITELGPNFRISIATPQLSHLLLPNMSIDCKALEGSLFTEHIADPGDTERFLAFVSTADALSTAEMSAAASCCPTISQVLHLKLRHAAGPLVPVKLFHCYFPDMDFQPRHLIGICHVGSEAVPQQCGEQLQEALELQQCIERQQEESGAFTSVSSCAKLAPNIDDDEISIPATTYTGNMFTGLMGLSENQLQDKLEQIMKIGHSEHWLISMGHVKLLPHRVLGAGGYGVVVEGQLHGIRVALKLPRFVQGAGPRDVAALANELQILRHVRHPNVVLLYGACIDFSHGDLALVFELVQGISLHDFIGLPGSRPDSFGRHKLILDVCGALKYMHALSPRVIHGDVKPSNVLVEEWLQGPRAKVLDFGLSRLRTRHPQPMGGTASWMAPEVILTRCLPAPSADVFSFGCLAYFIVMGQTRYADLDSQAIIAMVKKGLFAPLQWPRHVELCDLCRTLCDGALQFKAADRPSMATIYAIVASHTGLLPPSRNVLQTQPHPAPSECGSTCKSMHVSWEEGLRQLRQSFIAGDISLKFDVFDPEMPVISVTDGWLAFCGPVPDDAFINCLTAKIVPTFQEWLQEQAQLATWEEEEVTKQFQNVQGTHPDGGVYAASLMVSFPSQIYESEEKLSYVVTVSLRNTRCMQFESPVQLSPMPMLLEAEAETAGLSGIRRRCATSPPSNGWL